MPVKKLAKDSFIDVYVQAPEGAVPEKLHIVLNTKFKGVAEQYKNALYVSRGIPFNMLTVVITDPLAMTFTKLLEGDIPDSTARAQAALSMTIQTYERWAAEAEQEAWSLAMLADNAFTSEPTPYEPAEEGLPGLLPELNPARNLANRTERRLKQISDYLDQDFEFKMQVQTVINGAISEAISLVETDAAGFRSRGTH